MLNWRLPSLAGAVRIYRRQRTREPSGKSHIELLTACRAGHAHVARWAAKSRTPRGSQALMRCKGDGWLNYDDPFLSVPDGFCAGKVGRPSPLLWSRLDDQAGCGWQTHTVQVPVTSRVSQASIKAGRKPWLVSSFSDCNRFKNISREAVITHCLANALAAHYRLSQLIGYSSFLLGG